MAGADMEVDEVAEVVVFTDEKTNPCARSEGFWKQRKERDLALQRAKEDKEKWKDEKNHAAIREFINKSKNEFSFEEGVVLMKCTCCQQFHERTTEFFALNHANRKQTERIAAGFRMLHNSESNPCNRCYPFLVHYVLPAADVAKAIKNGFWGIHYPVKGLSSLSLNRIDNKIPHATKAEMKVAIAEGPAAVEILLAKERANTEFCPLFMNTQGSVGSVEDATKKIIELQLRTKRMTAEEKEKLIAEARRNCSVDQIATNRRRKKKPAYNPHFKDEHVREMLDAQNWCCAITGIVMGSEENRIFRPHGDRIDDDRAYGTDNVSFKCLYFSAIETFKTPREWLDGFVLRQTLVPLTAEDRALLERD